MGDLVTEWGIGSVLSIQIGHAHIETLSLHEYSVSSSRRQRNGLEGQAASTRSFQPLNELFSFFLKSVRCLGQLYTESW